MIEFWPHQTYAVDAVLAARERGCRSIILTSPTGGGKSLIVSELTRRLLEQQLRVALYTNRKLLIEQLSKTLDEFGLDHGIRAAGHSQEFHHLLQIASLQTEHARAIKTQQYGLHRADLVIVDEAHLQNNATGRAIAEAHARDGATILWVTATPLDMEGLAEIMIVAGNNSELRRCGALVPAVHFGPDEPDMREIDLTDAVTENVSRSKIMTPSIWGRVFEWFEKLNPDHKPTILFAPGVSESLWFAEQFTANGISAAHIDGNEIWVNGVRVPSTPAAREELLEGSRDGTIKVLCNRFVLREGIDAPWLAHGIFATIFGDLKTYLQSGGRILRSHPSLQSVTIQDHGGNWWRYGSLNDDRVWRLNQSARIVQGVREERLRAKKLDEPMRCPNCSKIVMRSVSFKGCPECGHQWKNDRKSRPVVMTNGEIHEHTGDIFKPRFRSMRDDTVKLWFKCYHRTKNRKDRQPHGGTFREAEALFFTEYHYYPPRTLKLMPKDDFTWFYPIKSVRPEELL